MIRVLVVEDSPLFSEALQEAIEEDGTLEVVAIAVDGVEAVRLAGVMKPDIVTMDLHLPKMSGLDAIREVLAVHPVPILVLTGDARGRGGELALEAVRQGALDLMVKPGLGAASREALRLRLRNLARVQVRAPSSTVRPSRPDPAARSLRAMVAIAASTGGPAALLSVLSTLPSDFPAPIAIVQHIGEGFTQTMASWLDRAVPFRVSVACAGQVLVPGQVVLAPWGRHLRLSRSGQVNLYQADPRAGHCPSADVLFESLATSYGAAGRGVVLTGMGVDGAQGLEQIRAAGGLTLAQDEQTCAVYGMPRAAVARGAVVRSLPLIEIGPALTRSLVVR